MTTIDVPPPVGGPSPLGIQPLVLSVYPKLHGIVGAQYGDLEFDVGKSVRWLDWFVDDLFIVDINTGEQRYWVVNWTETFPNSEHIVTGRNFFYDTTQAALFRKESFQWADKQFGYGDNDWVLFIDAHEGLSVDNRSLPDDWGVSLFSSWIYREIERVGAGTSVVLPFFAYLKYSDLQNITYDDGAPAAAQALNIPAVSQAVSVPWYLPVQGLRRLFKVSALRQAGFDWTTLDAPVAPTANCKIQIVSYAYAHWNIQDIVPPATTVADLSASNDDGWRMRNLMSRVRPIASIPYGDTWQPQATDPTSLPGPWCVDTVKATIAQGIETTVEEDGHTAPNAATAGITVPLYDTVMRLNLRDGMWYQAGATGNMPLAWDDVNQVWVPRYDPAQWDALGVGSDNEPPPAPSPMSLRLNGTAGTYCRTADANYFDYQHAFTLMAVLAMADWTPTGRQALVSKWSTAGGQRSYYWAVDAGGGMVLVWSRNGTASIEKKVVDPLFAPADGTPIAVAVSFVTNLNPDIVASDEPPQDEVRFWCWQDDMWMQCGDTAIEPNPTNMAIFNSTTEVQIGAIGGSTMNANGLFRTVSIRQGIGEDNTVGGVEYARMRGDITSNPSYDRYGNLWANQGAGWSYVPLPAWPEPT